MSELRSFELEAAIVGVAAAQRASDVLGSLSMPDLGLALPDLSAFDPWPALSRSFDQVASLFVQQPSGLFVPAAPAILSLPAATRPSGPADGQVRPAEPIRPGEWAGAIDPDGLVAFLRRRHPTKTPAHVAALTGESVETVRKWLKRETRPGWRSTLVLVCVYGPDLLDAALTRQPTWLAEVRAGVDRLRLADELAAMRRRIDLALPMAAT